jgi:hypothetical protein
MDQDLYEADEADALRVRLSSSGTSTAKVPSRAAHPYPGADVDMDVLSLVCLPSIKILTPMIFINSRTVYTPTSNTTQHTHNA